MNISARLAHKVPKAWLARLKQVSQAAEPLGLKPRLVGGAVRDLFLSGSFRQDLDVACEGGDIRPLAEELARKWGAQLLAYPRFLTFTLKFREGPHLDLVTARDESYLAPAALPEVRPAELNADLRRRDFSVNAMALSLARKDWGELLDPLEGCRDLQAKKIRVLHAESFRDDPTRIFRAARYAGRFHFRLEPETQKLLDESVRRGDVGRLSRDRIRVELEKILAEDDPATALGLLEAWQVREGLYPWLAWDLESLKKGQRKARSQAARWALLFLKHSSQEAEQVLRDLNFSLAFREQVLRMLRLHEAFLARRPASTLEPWTPSPEAEEFFAALQAQPRIKKGWKEYLKWVRCRPEIDGEGLIKLGFAPGPEFKRILDALALAKYRGRVKSRAQEIRFIVDNFRRP